MADKLGRMMVLGNSGTHTVKLVKASDGTDVPGGAVAITNTINDLVVTGIANWAFKNCTGLPGVTIPGSVTSIGDFAFIDCTNLTSVYFKGNAPGLGGMNVFKGDDKATIYYLPDKTGWGSSFGGRPTAPWNPQVRSNATSSVRSN